METAPEFEILLRPQVDALYRTAVRLCGDATGAEDLVQEAVVKAWRRFERFEPGTNFRAWMFTILTRTFLNEHRRKSRAPRLTDFSEIEPEGAADAPPLRAEDVGRLGDRIGDAVKHALDRLPDEHRAVFLLSTLEEMSYKEIASVLGIPIGTVMSRLFRARQILREELGEHARTEGWVQERHEP